MFMVLLFVGEWSDAHGFPLLRTRAGLVAGLSRLSPVCGAIVDGSTHFPELLFGAVPSVSVAAIP
jgi:hypothetical protein